MYFKKFVRNFDILLQLCEKIFVILRKNKVLALSI